MIKVFVRKNHRILFYSCWLLINLIQANYTELFDDEAYYWVYTRFPAWGYFDHPPMIAWLIQAGYLLFRDELGVRLLVVLMNTGTLLLVERLCDRKRPFLFYAICASIALVQIGGIIAVPDLPLLFFSALFFNCYERFTKNMSVGNAVLMGIVIALMLYSKYHGVLVVFFSLLSNFALLRLWKVYLAGVIALLFFAPHLYWQYQHDFPSVQFHLFERNAPAYRISFTLEYLGGQILLAGPVIGWLLIWASFRYRTSTLLERALKFTMAGFYLFFLLSTFKGRVEANWTVPALIGVIVLGHQYLISSRIANWVVHTVPLTLLLVFVVRIYMVLDLPKNSFIKKDEFHNNENVSAYFTEQASGMPVVFINSYQQASKQWFYSGEPSFSLNTPLYRRNNYNYWPLEDSLFGKPVLVTGKFDTATLKNRVQLPGFDSAGMKLIDTFYSFSKVRLKNIKVLSRSASMVLRLLIEVPSHYLERFQTRPADTSRIQLAVYKKDSTLYFPSNFAIRNISAPRSEAEILFNTYLTPGIYKARLGISSSVPGHPTVNSLAFDVKIE